MFKATTAAAALPPVQKKPNLFHILINPCEVFDRVEGYFLGTRDFGEEGGLEAGRTWLNDWQRERLNPHQLLLWL